MILKDLCTKELDRESPGLDDTSWSNTFIEMSQIKIKYNKHKIKRNCGTRQPQYKQEKNYWMQPQSAALYIFSIKMKKKLGPKIEEEKQVNAQHSCLSLLFG